MRKKYSRNPLKIDNAHITKAQHFFFFLLYILEVLMDFVWIRLYEMENCQMNRKMIITWWLVKLCIKNLAARLTSFHFCLQCKYTWSSYFKNNHHDSFIVTLPKKIHTYKFIAWTKYQLAFCVDLFSGFQ